MYLKLLILKYLQETGDFDETPLRQFLATHNSKITEYQSHFCTIGGLPACALLLAYQQDPIAYQQDPVPVPSTTLHQQVKQEPRQETKASKPKEEMVLTPKEMPLYLSLKKWRSDKAKKENVPPYVYFLNHQLVTIVRTRPKTLEDLKRVSGLGSVKVEKYGKDILEIVKIFVRQEEKVVEEIYIRQEEKPLEENPAPEMTVEGAEKMEIEESEKR